MTLRYVKQNNTYTCVPVALLNTLKWAGYHRTLSHLPGLIKKTKCYYPQGSYPDCFHKILRKYKKIKFYSRKKISIEDIDNHLDKNGIIIFIYYYFNEDIDDISGHASVIFEKSKDNNFYYLANENEQSEALLHRKEIISMIKRTYELKQDDILGYFISRRNRS